MKRSAIFFFGVSATLLSGCVLELKIQAKMEAGELVFHSSQQERRHWCLDRLTVADRASGMHMWRIEPDPNRQQRNLFCETDFPLRYGDSPPWLVTIVAPKPLTPGRVYVVKGSSGNNLNGAFVLDGATVRNVR